MTQDLNKLKEQYKKLGEEIKRLEEPQGINYVPKMHDRYCYITNEGLVGVYPWFDDEDDNMRLEVGNVYPLDGELANIIAENRKTLVKLRKHAFKPCWNDEDTRKWTFYINNDNKLSLTTWNLINHGALVYFSSEENAIAARKEVGDDAIKQLWEYREL